MTTIRLAHSNSHIGIYSQITEHGVSVRLVPYSERDSELIYQRYTKTFEQLNSRPYRIRKSGRSFKTLRAAVAAWKAENHIG